MRERQERNENSGGCSSLKKRVLVHISFFFASLFSVFRFSSFVLTSLAHMFEPYIFSGRLYFKIVDKEFIVINEKKKITELRIILFY